MILLIIIFIYLNLSIKKKENIINTQKFIIVTSKEYWLSFGVLSIFLILYVYCLRILRIVKDTQYINIIFLKEKLLMIFQIVKANYNLFFLILTLIFFFFF